MCKNATHKVGQESRGQSQTFCVHMRNRADVRNAKDVPVQIWKKMLSKDT